MEKFDTELLIDLVKKHPVLWDSSCEEYRDKSKKPKVWREIALTMYPTLEGSNLDAASTFVSKKWKNLKDNYVRSLRNKNFSGKKKIYIYTDAMSFLKISEEEIAEYGSIETSAVNALLQLESSEGEMQQNMNKSITPRITRKRKLPNLAPSVVTRLTPVTRLQPVVASTVETKKLEDKLAQFMEKLENTYKSDEDQSFFNSILPAVREFDLNQKLEFRTQVLTLVQNMRKIKGEL